MEGCVESVNMGTLTDTGSCRPTTVEGCLIEEMNGCRQCDMSMVIIEGKCVTPDGMTQSNGHNISTECDIGYYNEDGTCHKCTDTYGDGCEECDKNTCSHCVSSDGVRVDITNTGQCEVIKDCNENKAHKTAMDCVQRVSNTAHIT